MKLKHNKYWFVPKTFGWGFVPISWEGWLSTLILLMACMISAYTNGFFENNDNLPIGNVLRFLFDLAVIVSLATIFFKPKTKGELRWRFGK